MTTTINGRTPDEIKKGLACSEKRYCIYESCPYYSIDDLFECLEKSREDALAYIQQLERERDAAVEDLAENRRCETCKHYSPGYFCMGCRRGDKWEWRGVQEVE